MSKEYKMESFDVNLTVHERTINIILEQRDRYINDKSSIEGDAVTMYKKFQYICANRHCSHGFAFRNCFCRYFCDRNWKFASAWVRLFNILKNIRWWYDLFYKKWYHQIHNTCFKLTKTFLLKVWQKLYHAKAILLKKMYFS